jgi:hypothetical protein
MATAGVLKMIRVPTPVLRAVQALFSVVVLALSGYGTASPELQTVAVHMDAHRRRRRPALELTQITVANWYNTDTLTSSPTQVNIMIFSGILSIVSLILLEGVPRIFPRCKSPLPYTLN